MLNSKTISSKPNNKEKWAKNRKNIKFKNLSFDASNLEKSKINSSIHSNFYKTTKSSQKMSSETPGVENGFENMKNIDLLNVSINKALKSKQPSKCPSQTHLRPNNKDLPAEAGNYPQCIHTEESNDDYTEITFFE